MAEDILTNIHRTADSSRHGVSLTVYQDRLYVAWTGTDECLNVMCSTDGGRSFDRSTRHTSAERSYARPSLAVHQGRLYVAWAGTDGYLNMMYSTDDGRTFNTHTKSVSRESCYSALDEKFWLLMPIARYQQQPAFRGLDGPSLAVYQDRLYVAWTGEDGHLNLMWSKDDGKTFDASTKWTGQDTSYRHEESWRDTQKNTMIITASSYPGPVLSAWNNQLYIAWTGTDTSLNVMVSRDNGRSFDPKSKQTLKQSSHSSPTLTAFRGRPILAWSSWQGSHLTLCPFSGTELETKGASIPLVARETSKKAPMLTVYRNQLFMAWVDGWSEEWGGRIHLASIAKVEPL